MSSFVPRASFALVLTLAWVTATSMRPSPASAQQVPTSSFAPMQYRHIGPLGNRITSVTGVPGDRFTYYAGAASGGLWKTEDGGVNWRPVFDDQPVHSVGEVEVAPSDPNIVWAGTGEPFIRSNVSIGNGVWKSTDAGETWTHMGLEGTGRISRIIVHPTDPDIVYAAAIGHGYAPQPERGIYRTLDGGASWEHVLFVDEETGASDLVMDPNNPRILFAGTWQIAIRTWTRTSGGPGSAIHVSRDGGTTWIRLAGNGLPTREIGKIALCMSRADSRRIYALIETGDGVPWEGGDTDGGELWRSDDGGHNWSLVSYDRDLAGRTAYYTRCEANPDDPDEAYFLAAVYSTTLDGGVTSSAAGFLEGPVWDHHDMWIDPYDGNRQIVGGDGGLAISGNRGRTWFRAQLPVAQMYHVTVDNAIPYNVMGNRQDGPSTRGPSNSRMGARIFGVGIPRGLWHSVGGGESGFATPDPTDPNIVWSSASGVGAGGGIVSRWDARTGQYREVEVWPESTTGHPADSLRYRFQWTFPLLISPHDNNTVYVTSQHVHRTTDRGQSWEVISPDLSTNDRSRMGISGGLTPDNIGVEYCCVIYAFDESPLEPGVLWAGTNDGLMHVSRDGGANWTNVTANIPDLPPDGVVRGIDASRYTAGKAYMVIEHHQVGDFEARAYRTDDYGESWTPITEGIDDGVLSYTRAIHEDPVRPGLLYLGTEASVYVSFDDGDRWQKFHTNLPPRPHVRARRAGALQRPGGRHLRTRVLDPGRCYASPAAHPRGGGERGPPLRPASRLPVPADLGALHDVRRPVRRREPALRRLAELLARRGDRRQRGRRDRERDGRGRPHPGGHGQRGRQPGLVGPDERSGRGGPPAHQTAPWRGRPVGRGALAPAARGAAGRPRRGDLSSGARDLHGDAQGRGRGPDAATGSAQGSPLRGDTRRHRGPVGGAGRHPCRSGGDGRADQPRRMG